MISYNHIIHLCNSSQVSYNLVAAYETTAGMKSFAESDSFNVTGTVFHFAVLSSVTSCTFTVTPYSATQPGESASLLVDDFSNLTTVEGVCVMLVHDTLLRGLY